MADAGDFGMTFQDVAILGAIVKHNGKADGIRQVRVGHLPVSVIACQTTFLLSYILSFQPNQAVSPDRNWQRKRQVMFKTKGRATAGWLLIGTLTGIGAWVAASRSAPEDKQI